MPEIDECNQYIKKEELFNDFTENCINSQKCEKGINFKNYVTEIGTNNCTRSDSIFYVQYFCRQRSSRLLDKKLDSLLITCLGVLISLLFLITIYYLSKSNDIDYKLWDVKTVTPADFTVEYLISEKAWKTFLELP